MTDDTKNVREKRAMEGRARVHKMRKDISEFYEKEQLLVKEKKDLELKFNDTVKNMDLLRIQYLRQLKQASEDKARNEKEYIELKKKAVEKAAYRGEEFMESPFLKKLRENNEKDPKDCPTMKSTFDKFQDEKKLHDSLFDSIEKIPVEIKSLGEMRRKLYDNVKELEPLVLQDEWYDRYVDYARGNGIDWEEDEDQLFKLCNKIHQENLKRGYHSDKVSHHCEGLENDGWNDGKPCTGWTIGEYRCDCGNFKGWSWNEDDFDPTDLSFFNIDSTEPFGYADAQW